MQLHRRPDLRPAVQRLLATLVPAVQSGGRVPLAELVTAVAAGRVTAQMLAKLEARGDVRFAPVGDSVAFDNEGPPLALPLKRFHLEIGRRVSGRARMDGDGVRLEFSPRETLRAKKLLVSIRLEALDVRDSRVFVDMEGELFDQMLDLA